LRCLVACAGDRTGGEWLVGRWLPGLRGAGGYEGDVLILDFDLKPWFREELLEDNRVFVEPASFDSRGSGYVQWIRHEYYSRLLMEKYSDYDVVACLDGDLLFQSPVLPLLELAVNEFCCVAERVLNGAWLDMRVRDHPDAGRIWEAIRDKPMVNCGVYAGPLEAVLFVERFLSDRCRFYRVDQAWVNALLYVYGFSMRLVDDTWNFSRGYLGRVSGDAYFTPEGVKAAIYHCH